MVLPEPQTWVGRAQSAARAATTLISALAQGVIGGQSVMEDDRIGALVGVGLILIGRDTVAR